ncbi:transcriptional regulator, CdaR family [Frankineae bacterium MT45]|nr:transcriptional regulator, CdaR family [Frankineae bacterium MT45]
MDSSNSSISLDEAFVRLSPGRVQVVVDAATPLQLASVSIVAAEDPTTATGERLTAAAVLGVGAHGHVAAELVEAAAERGASLVVLRGGGRLGLRAAEAVARTSGIALWQLADECSWSGLHTELSALITPPPGQLWADDELAGLAQTIATLTGGLVTIEDMQSRVLAYSVSGEEVDELRRLSILGRSGPAAYLALLRELGVYDRLGVPDQVVEVAEDPTSGIRRRLAVGVFAGSEQLGTIWVQQGANPFGENAATALLGAARVAAADLAVPTSRGGRPANGSSEESRFAAVLAGRSPSLLGWSPRLSGLPCVVAGFALDDDATEASQSARWTAAVGKLLRVHAAALRTRALVAEADGRVYLLLPDVTSADDVAEVADALRRALADAQRLEGGSLRAALGPVVSGVAQLARSRRGADLALDSAADSTVGSAEADPLVLFDQIRPRLFVEVLAQAARASEELSDAALDGLTQSQPQLAQTLLTYLDLGSDVVACAAELGIHPTTARYRLRRVNEILPLNLDDPDERLAVHLQLRSTVF